MGRKEGLLYVFIVQSVHPKVLYKVQAPKEVAMLLFLMFPWIFGSLYLNSIDLPTSAVPQDRYLIQFPSTS